MQILQRNDVSAQAVAAMGSQFVVENGMVRLEHSQPLVFRPFVHRMPPTQVIGVPDATVLLNEDAMVENVSPRLMPLKVVLQGNGSTQDFGTEVLDANLVAYEDFAGLLGDHRSASGAFSDSSVAASEKRDPFYRTSAAPVDSSSRRVKLMCSFGGRILPRPSDGKLRYVGGETRILSVSRHITYADLLLKLSETYGESLSLKYQLPDEDIESLISVCSDEDLENMMEEFDRLDAGESSSKLRVFLFLAADHDPLHLNDTADRRNSEQKYVDAVNSVGGVCLRNSAEFNSSHDLIGLQLSDVKTSGLPEPETLLTPVTATEVDLQTVAVGMPVPPKLYSGKTLTLSAIPTSSFVAPQPSPVNYQYCTLKTELSHQDLELADSARSSAASHPDLFYHFPGMLEADSLSRMFQSSGIVFSSQEQQKELTTHPGATNTTLGDPSPGMAMPRIDFHQSHLQAPPQTDFIQTSWQHPADEHLSSPTSSVSGNVQKQTLQQEQQTSTVYTPAAHEAMFFKYMDQQQQQEEVLAGPLPSQVAAGPIFQTGSPPSSPCIGLVENINKKFGNMQHMQGYLAFNGGLVDEEHGGILYHNNNQTGRVFHPLNPYLAHVEQAASQLPVVNIENRQKQIINLAHGKYEPSHVPSKPTVSPYLVLGSYYDGFWHCQDGTIEDQILLEEQQSHSFPNSDSNQDFVLQPDRQPFFCYFNDKQGNMDGAFQHRENDSHEGKLCTGLQSHVKQMDLKEKESVANLAFKSYAEFPSEKFPVPNSPEESTSLPDFAATSVGNDPIESTPFYLRTPLYPKGDAEQALVFNPVVVSEGLHAAQLSRRPEMDSLLVHTKPNTVTLALDVLKDSSISIPASNDSTCVPMSQRSFVASNDNSNVFEGQRSSAEKLPDSKLSQLPLQISSLVAGTGSNASESFFSAENETQLTEDFQFNAAEAEVRQQSLLIRGPANDEFSMYKSSLHGNASNRMDSDEGLPLHHSTSTKSLIDDASGVLPYSDHHSSNSVASVSYPELLATLANGFDCSLVNAAIAASHVTSFLPEAVTTHHTLSPSIDLLPVSIHSQPSMNFMVEGAQDQVKEGAKIALKSEFRGLNYTSLDVLKKSENMDPLSSLTSSEEQYNHVKDQSSSFAQLHIHDLENEPKRSSSEHTRESASAAFIQPTLYSAPTLSIQNWEKSLTEAEVEEQDVATDLSQERLSETVKPNAIGEKEVIFEEIKMGMEEEDMHEYKIHQPNNLAAIAEAEAISRGLQIIKNADLEELRELGAGTFGTVYHGKWRGTDVAIKRIKSSCFTGRPSERERLIADFWQEAWILSQLHHPNVVAFYGVVPDAPGGTLATVTEFMVNGSLKQVLQRKDRTIDRRKRLLIAMDAAFGMEYLHGKNIVHFDLKCENLLVNMRDPQRSICKVGDLGLSKIKHQTMVSGGVRGTLPWMAPELLNGSSSLVSEKVDVFSFGIVMWELLTGEEPYANMHYGAIIGGIVNNTLRPSVPNWCDPAWKSLMECCWSSEPNERPSFPDIARALRAMAASLHARGQTQTQGKTSPGANAGM